MYPGQWHQVYGDKTGTSARAILPPLIERFGVRSLVEVGCGNAHWTQAGIDTGVADYAVVDGPWNDRDQLLVDRSRFLEADLRRPLQLGRRFDLALCLEVAEHVPHESADVVVRSLCALSDVILFGAAIPFQGGYGHINEQWPSWWREKFEREGYRPYDLVRPQHWNDSAIHYWYRQNAFVYVSEANVAATAAAGGLAAVAPPVLFDAVHPEKYAEIASYEGIALKRMVRALPRWTVNRLKSKLGGLH